MTAEELLKEAMALTLFQTPPEDLRETAVYHVALKALSDLCTKRLKSLRNGLLEATEEGFHTKTGRALDIGELTVEKQLRVSKLPDVNALRDKLDEEGIELQEAFDVVRTLQMNPSKIEYLIEIGKLEREDVVALHKQSEALKVTPSRNLKRRITSITQEG